MDRVLRCAWPPSSFCPLRSTCSTRRDLFRDGFRIFNRLDGRFEKILPINQFCDGTIFSPIVSGYEYSDIYGYSASGPVTIVFDIPEFDTTLGTLISVDFGLGANADGSLQAWYYGEAADLNYELTNTVTVAGVSSVATAAGSEPIVGEPDWGAVSFFFPTTNNYSSTTFTSGLSQFLNPVQVSMTLFGAASSTDPGMTDVYFDFNGWAQIDYTYNYTYITETAPVPEPSTALMVLLGLVGTVGYARRRRS